MPARKFDDLPTSGKTPISDPRPFEQNIFSAITDRETVKNDSLSNAATDKNFSAPNRFVDFRKASKKIFAASLFLAGCLSLLLFLPKAKPPAEDSAKEECKCETNLKTVNFGFPDLADEYKPPRWWEVLNQENAREFSIFRLSQDFPVELLSESCADGVRFWENFDFRTQSKEYMTEALKYAFEGNLEIDWRVQQNPVRKWVHAPWMHAGRYGREFVRGLTRERKTCRTELLGINEECAPDEAKYQSWAIAVYNARAAFYLGKIWEEMTQNDAPSAKNFPTEGFPDGSVSLKLIFTQADAGVAPYLENSVEWLADTRRSRASGFSAGECLTAAGEPAAECFEKLRLLQVDIAARDERSPTGWVFGTFTYNKDAEPIFDYPFAANLSAPEKEYLQRWLKLEFVGLMFGNDEGVRRGENLSETVINRRNAITPHLGCGGRLNGMIDAPASSCFSCHALAETPQNLKIEPMPYKDMECRDDRMAKWFRTVNPRDADLNRRTFTKSEAGGKEIVSLDFSLQLREGIIRYCEENRQKCSQ